MKILEIEKHSIDELIANMRQVQMLTKPGVLPYEKAKIELLTLRPEQIAPAQRYVLRDEINKIRELRWGLEQYGVDLFYLDGYVTIRLADCDDLIDVLPPVVEVSNEDNDREVKILNDGMHRVYMALTSWSDIRVVLIDGVPPEYPYYAYPLYNGWDGVEVLNELPEEAEGYIKKWHRFPNNKDYYRNFNSGGFQNVGGPRPPKKAA